MALPRSFARLHYYLGLVPNRLAASIVGRKTPVRVSPLVETVAPPNGTPQQDQESTSKMANFDIFGYRSWAVPSSIRLGLNLEPI